VLVATIPAAAERLSRLLLGQRLVSPLNLAEAQAALSRERFALAVMGVHFDESRMFDLVSSARASPLNRDVPIICVLGLGEHLQPALPERTLQQIEPSSI